MFGMGTGGALSPLSPEIVFICERDVCPGVFLLGIAFAILLCKTALLLLAVENVYVDRTFVRGISEIRNRFHDSSI